MLTRQRGEPCPTVAIVGAGASGILLAAHLLTAATAAGDTPVRAVLIDRTTPCGGVAYATDDPNHRLNVTAARMSAFPDCAEHFVRWRARHIGDEEPGAYAARWEYRCYLEDVLVTAQREAAAGVGLARIVAGVARLDVLPTHVRLRFAGGGALDADAAVLALGNPPPLPPAGFERVRDHPAYVNDPWAPGALERRAPPGPAAALLIGTGLTMVDVAISLAARHPHMRLLADSRRGLLPRAHLRGRTAPKPIDLERGVDAPLPAAVDAIIARSASGDAHWHQLVDDLRPHTQRLWRRMSTAERVEFLATRHRAWCVLRHRMPPQVASMLADLIGTGRLTVRSGSVDATRASASGLTARISPDVHQSVALAVNCTGPALDPRTNADPLVGQLLADGHARTHATGFGFDTLDDGAFRSADAIPSRRLFTLGPPRIGELYETTAVPEIRAQAQALAETLVTRLLRGSEEVVAQPA